MVKGLPHLRIIVKFFVFMKGVTTVISFIDNMVQVPTTQSIIHKINTKDVLLTKMYTLSRNYSSSLVSSSLDSCNQAINFEIEAFTHSDSSSNSSFHEKIASSVKISLSYR